MIDEVVVVGYGVQKKENLTGSVAAVIFMDVAAMPVANSANMLQGRLPGVMLTNNGAQAGHDSPEIRIRGVGTFDHNDPMVLIDGVESSVSQIAEIPADDIESVSVLKDAASAALYGARGANGGIILQTKKGNAEKSTLSVKAVWGFSSRAIPEYSRIGIKDNYETSWEAYRNALVGTGQSMEKASEYAAANLIN